jgi:ribosome-binding factor A
MSERALRVESIIKELVAAFVRREANASPMITITKVEVRSDGARASVFFTTLPEGSEAEAEAFLKRSGGEMRGYIKRSSRLRRIPFMDFLVDVGERHRQHIDEIARALKKPSRPRR